jgi:prepilin-type N-terminal cleavage/methylation domain-containing protein
MRGFTLIECLIYLALFGLVMSGTMSGFVALTESANRAQTLALLDTEGSFLIQKIDYDLAQTGTTSIPLLGGGVTIGNTSFQKIGAGGADPKAIHSSFTLSTLTANGLYLSQGFSNTTYLLP